MLAYSKNDFQISIPKSACNGESNELIASYSNSKIITMACTSDSQNKFSYNQNDSKKSVNNGNKQNSNIVCVVCEDKSSGKHYGQFTCEGCKSFFKRSVRRNLNYQCRASKNCPIDQYHRNQCQYCRFKKCLKMGMKREAVQRGRIANNEKSINSTKNTPYNYLQSPTINYLTTNFQYANSIDIFSPFSFLNPLSENPYNRSKYLTNPFSTSSSPETFINSLIKAQVPLSLPLTNTNALFDFQNQLNLKIPIDEYTKDQIHSDSSRTESYSSPQQKQQQQTNLESINELASCVLINSIEWCTLIPVFSKLNINDQISLLQYSWIDLFILNMAQYNYLNLYINNNNENNDDSSTAAYEEHISNTDDCITYLKKIQNQIEKIQLLSLDEKEYACLKAILLFTTDLTNLSDTNEIDNFQQTIQLIYEQYIKYKYKNENYSRFGQIVLKLKSILKHIDNNHIEKAFFSTLINNHNYNNISIDRIIKEILRKQMHFRNEYV